MQEWEQLLGIRWPKSACDRSGECCRGAAQSAPWQNLLKNAAAGDLTARSFLNQYIPYPTLEEARRHAPDGVAASLAIAQARSDKPEDIIFYHCRFLKGQSECQIYEDRPALCREFPESPFGAIPSCCGYANITRQCLSKIDELKQELMTLKQQQAMNE